MTPSVLVAELKKFAEDCTRDIQLPVRAKQTETPELKLRAPMVYAMDLPSKEDDTKLAPYIVVQLLPGVDRQKQGEDPESVVQVRFVSVCYCDNMGEGKMYVLNVIERLRERLLKQRVLAEHFSLAYGEDVEYFVNLNPLVPYFDGELVAKFEIPPILPDFDSECSAGSILRSEIIDGEEEMKCPVRR